MDMEKTIGRGYVYNLLNGVLVVQEGEVSKYFHDDRLARFITKKNKMYLTFSTPGIMYNSNVWLLERDDNLAIDLMIAYEQNMIATLEEKTKNHRDKIINLLNLIIIE